MENTTINKNTIERKLTRDLLESSLLQTNEDALKALVLRTLTKDKDIIVRPVDKVSVDTCLIKPSKKEGTFIGTMRLGCRYKINYRENTLEFMSMSGFTDVDVNAFSTFAKKGFKQIHKELGESEPVQEGNVYKFKRSEEKAQAFSNSIALLKLDDIEPENKIRLNKPRTGVNTVFEVKVYVNMNGEIDYRVSFIERKERNLYILKNTKTKYSAIATELDDKVKLFVNEFAKSIASKYGIEKLDTI